MKPGFILISHWNLNFNRVPQLREDSGGREADGFRGQPRLVFHDCLFVGHNGFTATAMPTLLKGIRAVEAFGETGSISFHISKGGGVCLHCRPMHQVRRGLDDILGTGRARNHERKASFGLRDRSLRRCQRRLRCCQRCCQSGIHRKLRRSIG